MNLSQFPRCCGASTLSGLSLEGYFYYSGEQKQQKIVFIKNISNRIQESKNQFKGLILAITNSEQRASVTIMKQFGFKLLRKFYNPNSRSKLRLWELNLNKISGTKIQTIAKKLINSL